MQEKEIQALVARQRQFFFSGKTLPLDYRIRALKALKQAIAEKQDKIADALYRDLGKSEAEGFMCETGLVLSEISYMLRHIRRFAREKTVYTPLSQFAASSRIRPTPYGVTLIMSPWNYPFLLTVEPLSLIHILFVVYFVSVTTVGTWATDWANDGVFGEGWHLFGIGSAAYELSLIHI